MTGRWPPAYVLGDRCIGMSPIDLAVILLVVGVFLLVLAWMVGWIVRIIAILILIAGLYYLVTAFFGV